MAENAGVQTIPAAANSVQERTRVYGWLFLASFIALYFELLVIRYLSSELEVFATLKNLPLIASFFGIGIGMLRGEAMRGVRRAFVIVAPALFILARFGARLKLPTLSWEYNPIFGKFSVLLSFLAYLLEVLSILWLTVLFFVVLGGLIGKYFQQAPALRAYGVNLAGSLAGMLAFTVLSFLSTPPAVWLAIGFALISLFFWREWKHLGAFALLVGITAIPQQNVYWSPYHRIDLMPIRATASAAPTAYILRYNHMWYQTMANLSPGFMMQHPNAEPNRSLRDYYELPYRFVAPPREVLIVGAGTGNDVAAALRHGAEHVDAVEIDPRILGLGSKYHPEEPYASPKVVAHIDDARAYFNKCQRKYDLIVFGFLDSQTLLASSSSLRLDNYVYTRQSFEAARKLLKPNGTLVLAFAVTRGYVANRLFVTLTEAFGTEPRAFITQTLVWGMVYVEGAGRSQPVAPDVPEVTAELHTASYKTAAATDNWPFLYLKDKRVPFTLGMAMMLFVAGLWLWQGDPVQQQSPSGSAQFFLLGVGFLLLETRAVTQLSLLFGSTWLVVAVVVTVFLCMALAANALVIRIKPNIHLCYGAILLTICLGMVLPYSLLAGSPMVIRILAAALGAALPVFFSGMVFSSALKQSASPTAALALNLLGAVIGGVLENAVMIGGIPLVGGLALLSYAVAWLCASSRAKDRNHDKFAVPSAVSSAQSHRY